MATVLMPIEQLFANCLPLFSEALDAVEPPGRHHVIAVSRTDEGVITSQAVCSCGWVSLPWFRATDASVTCAVYLAERERWERACGSQGYDARRALAELHAQLSSGPLEGLS